MEIRTIRIRFGRTINLGNYENARPEIELTADLMPGDDPDAVEDELATRALEFVHRRADEALEQADQPAQYDTSSPRYWLIGSRQRSHYWHDQPIVEPPIIAIVPAGIETPPAYYTIRGSMPGLRLAHALRIAEQHATPEHRIIQTADLATLPQPVAPPVEEPPADGDAVSF